MKISIVTATRDAASFIETCLKGVHSQVRSEGANGGFEIEQIIVDAASQDDTVEQVRRIAPSVRILSEPDRGIFDGMNKGIRMSTGDIVGTLNADDFYFRGKVLAVVARAMRDPSVDACYGNVVYVSAAEPWRVIRVWREGRYNARRLRRGWMPPHPTLFIRRACYERYGLYREDFGTAADYELIVRFLAKEGLRPAYVPELWVAMRVGGASNASIVNRLRANHMDRRAWTVNGLRPSPWLRLSKPTRKIPQYAGIGSGRLGEELRIFAAECEKCTAGWLEPFSLRR